MPSIWLAVAIVDSEKITMNDVTTIAHTNTGMRLAVIPGARIFNAVAMISTASTRLATSLNVTICAYTSGRVAGGYYDNATGT